jgi:hypothetical protein
MSLLKSETGEGFDGLERRVEDPDGYPVAIVIPAPWPG